MKNRTMTVQEFLDVTANELRAHSWWYEGLPYEHMRREAAVCADGMQIGLQQGNTFLGNAKDETVDVTEYKYGVNSSKLQFCGKNLGGTNLRHQWGNVPIKTVQEIVDEHGGIVGWFDSRTKVGKGRRGVKVKVEERFPNYTSHQEERFQKDYALLW